MESEKRILKPTVRSVLYLGPLFDAGLFAPSANFKKRCKIPNTKGYFMVERRFLP
jgi:hypothetical protein